jgi:hypothetical protein
MHKLIEEYPTDIDASAKWADSVMLLDPWRYYDNISGESKTPKYILMFNFTPYLSVFLNR